MIGAARKLWEAANFRAFELPLADIREDGAVTTSIPRLRFKQTLADHG
jgi:hypothetical protein